MVTGSSEPSGQVHATREDTQTCGDARWGWGEYRMEVEEETMRFTCDPKTGCSAGAVFLATKPQ